MENIRKFSTKFGDEEKKSISLHDVNHKTISRFSSSRGE